MAKTSNIINHLIACLKTSEAKKILDVGCGKGALSRELSNVGFQLTGIEPNEESIKKAEQNVPEATFIIASAEDIPVPDQTFDAVLLLNSFHHIPLDVMQKALDEFKRVLNPEGELIIIEPLTHGSFFEAMRPVEDETEIRHHALSVLHQVVDDHIWDITSRTELDRISLFRSCDDFIDQLVSVDPTRQEAAKSQKELIENLFHQFAHKENDKYSLIQPHTIWRLKPV